jgi:hypothetical protein
MNEPAAIPEGPAALAIQPPVSELVKRLVRGVINRAETLVAGRGWMFRVLWIGVFFSIFLGGGIDLHALKSDNDQTGNGYPDAYYRKIEHPLLSTVKISPVGSHERSIDYRLTVPVILHVLGIRGMWTLPILTICAITGNILIACLFAFQVTRDRVCALFVALGVAATHTGSFEVIGYYDAIAVLQLALAMLPATPALLRGFLVFTAAFTDERALVAAGLLLTYECTTEPAAAAGRRGFPAGATAILAGMLVYCLARTALSHWTSLTSPRVGTGPIAFLAHIRFWHPAVWFSLKGGWLLVALAMLALWQRRQLFALRLFVVAIAAVLVGALMVGDVMRSATFVYPAVLVALAILARNETPAMLRVYCLAAFVISALGGDYNIVLEKITWFMPFPVQMLDLAGHLLYGTFIQWFPGYTFPLEPW